MSTRKDSIRVLNRILAMQQYSPANYLLEAHPWAHRGDERLWETVQHIAGNQRHYAERVAALIVERDGVIASATYPLRFTAWNDLALDYLIERLMEHQRSLIRALEECVSQLEGDPPAHELAQEILGAEKGHLETLMELTATHKELASAVG